MKSFSVLVTISILGFFGNVYSSKRNSKHFLGEFDEIPVAKTPRIEGSFVDESVIEESADNHIIQIYDDNSQETGTVENVEDKASVPECAILVLPANVIAFISSYFKYPYAILPSVCKAFNFTFKMYTPQAHLQCISSFNNMISLRSSEEMRNLLSLPRSFLNQRFDQLVAPGSFFTPKSPVMAELAVAAILKKYFTPTEINLHITALVHNLIANENYSSILAVMKLLPDGIKVNLEFDFFYKIFGFTLTSGLGFLETFNLVSKAVTRPFTCLFAAMSYPNEITLHSVLEFIGSAEINHDLYQKAFARSLIKFDTAGLSEEILQVFYNRNRSIIEHFAPHATEIFVEYCRVINEMKFASNDEPLDKEFLINLSNLLRPSLYLNSLVKIAVERKYMKIFYQLTKLPALNTWNAEFRNIFKINEEFLSSLSDTKFNEIFGSADKVFRFKHNRMAVQEVYDIHNVYDSIRVILELPIEPELIQANIKSNQWRFDVKKMIKLIVKLSDEPARKVHHVFVAIRERQFDQIALYDLGKRLGSPKYISSLLKPENADIFTLPINALFIPINKDNFKIFYKAAVFLGAEILAPLRKHLKINWISVFKTPSIYAHELERFFKVLGLSIDNLQVFKTLSSEDRSAIKLIKTDSTNLFIEPEIWSNYLGEVFFQTARRIFAGDMNVLGGRLVTEPCSMKCFAIYQLLMETNYENFIIYAPEEILHIFSPRITLNLMRKVLLKPEANRELLIKVLLVTKTLKLEIKTLKELGIFLKTALPYLHSHHASQFFLDLWIDWEKIINEADSIAHFTMIVKYIEAREFYRIVLGLERTRNMDYFIQVYLELCADNLDGKTGFNRDFLTDFTSSIVEIN